jgi:hypothetical protein
MIKLIKRYRPERHYMRGPGPKWLEKHGGGIDRIGRVTHSLASSFSFARQATLRRGWLKP